MCASKLPNTYPDIYMTLADTFVYVTMTNPKTNLQLPPTPLTQTMLLIHLNYHETQHTIHNRHLTSQPFQRPMKKTLTKHQNWKTTTRETTPIPVIHDIPIITATKPALETLDKTSQPTENTQTENDTESETDQQSDIDTDTGTEMETETDTTTKSPTLNSYEKKENLPERQIHTLYWRGYVNFEGSMKKRYKLYPNQFYRIITDQNEQETYYKKNKHGGYYKYKDLQNDIRQKSRYFDIDRQINITVRKKKT